jgi:hypothetical protein
MTVRIRSAASSHSIFSFTDSPHIKPDYSASARLVSDAQVHKADVLILRSVTSRISGKSFFEYGGHAGGEAQE